MLQKIKMTILSFMSLFMFAAPLAAAGVAHAQTNINDNLKCGANIKLEGGDCPVDSGETKLDKTISTVINVVSLVVAAISVVMIIIGGLRYVTSGGKQESVTAAKNTIMYALIGLVIVALAQIIVHFVLKKTTDATA